MKDNNKQPFLCSIGLHFPTYRYMPKVGGPLRESIACKRCGYGKAYNGWYIKPKDVLDSVKKQADIEFGRVLNCFPSLCDPLTNMELSLEILVDSGKFTDDELKHLKARVRAFEDL